MLTALESARSRGLEVVVELSEIDSDDELGQQRAAVRLLDAICFVFD
jgi:hypothetical protein